MTHEVDTRAAAIFADSTPGRMFWWLLPRAGAAWTHSAARALAGDHGRRFWLVAATTAAVAAAIGRRVGFGL